MKTNISKCHLLVNKKDEVTLRTEDTESKCHLLVNKKDEVTLRTEDTETKNSKFEISK